MSIASTNANPECITLGNLTSSREFFSRATPAMLHSIDEDGYIISASDFWLKKLGYNQVEVFGKKSIDFLTEASRDYALREVIPAFFRDGHCENIQYQMVKKTGEIIDVLLSAILDRSTEDGRSVSIAITTDITALKQAERRLAESEMRYRIVVEGQTDLVSLATIDGRLMFVNEAYAAQYGKCTKELLGQNLFEFIPENERATVRGNFDLAAMHDHPIHSENQIVAPDGSTRWIAWTNKVLHGEPTTVHSVGRDITDRRLADEKLASSESKYRLLADHSTDMVYQLDRNLVRTYVSPASRQILGYEPEDLIGAEPMNLAHPEDAHLVREAFEALLSGELDQTTFSNRIRHKDDHWIWVEARVRSTIDAVSGRPNGVIGTLRDISAKKLLQDQLAEAVSALEALATRDGLTGLLNRRSFDKGLGRELKRAHVEDNCLSLLLLDIDYFKPYNDTYGHPAGDECLRKVASTIAKCLRSPNDLAARYGGEEFGILLPNTGSEGAFQVAEEIRRSICELRIPHSGTGANVVTVSVGLASTEFLSLGAGGENVLLQIADAALYRAKGGGRNRVEM